MTNAHPPFNPKLSENAQPKWLVEWQAIPLILTFQSNDEVVPGCKAALQIAPVIIVQEDDTSLTNIVRITCTDEGHPPPGAKFTVTYVLYAIFTNL
jgi:hypothetical protein